MSSEKQQSERKRIEHELRALHREVFVGMAQRGFALRDVRNTVELIIRQWPAIETSRDAAIREVLNG